MSLLGENCTLALKGLSLRGISALLNLSICTRDAGRGAMHLTKYSVSVFAGAFFILALCGNPALADKRVALVIGNSSYQNVPKLPNPSADASAVAQMFKNAGFEVVNLQIDVGNLDYKRAIRRFEDVASDADMAVVFFAGHGIELRGTNYMIPVDAKLADERDAPDEAIALDRIVEAVSGAKRLRLVIIDACRDNPFGVSMRRQVVQRTTSRGLTKVEPQSTDTLIAYAAKAGSTAEDGHGEHSPLTTALLDNLTVPGLDIRLAFGRVRDEVMKITSNKQEPFVYGSLGGGIISLVPEPSQPIEPTPANVKADYELVEKIGTRKAWEVFLATYKTGFYAELAAAQLAKLNLSEQASAKVATLEPPAPPSPPVPTSDEARAWDKIKDLGDQAAVQAFIKRYPNSPLALTAQRRLETLQQIVKEQEEKARAEREAAQQRADEERRAKAAEAERQKAAQLAAQQQAEDERRAKAAEAERQKAALAALQQAEEERRAKAAEAERQKAAQLAAQQAAAQQAARQKADDERWQMAAQLARQQVTALQKAEEAERQKAAQLAAQQAAQAEEERRAKAAEAERQKAAQLAAPQRAEEERRAKAAEAERQKAAQLAAQQAAQAEEDRRAKAAEAERQKAAQLAAQQQAEEERRAKAAEAERQKAAQLAAQQAAQAEEDRRAKAAEAERQKAAQLAAQQQAEEERRAKAAAEAERQKAAQLAAQQQAEEELRAKAAEAERQKAAQLAAQQQAEEERRAKAAEAERQKAAQLAVQQAAQQQAEEQDRAKAALAERLKAAQQAATDSDKLSMAETAAPQSATTPSSEQPMQGGGASRSDLIRAAQTESTRLGCFSGDADGTVNAATQVGISRYLSRRGRRNSQMDITEIFVSELRGQHTRICPLDCPAGQTAEGNTCVADKKSSKPTKAVRREEEIQRKPAVGRARGKQEAAPPRPQVHQEVSAAPREFHSAGGGGGGTTIGVGF